MSASRTRKNINHSFIQVYLLVCCSGSVFTCGYSLAWSVLFPSRIITKRGDVTKRKMLFKKKKEKAGCIGEKQKSFLFFLWLFLKYTKVYLKKKSKWKTPGWKECVCVRSPWAECVSADGCFAKCGVVTLVCLCAPASEGRKSNSAFMWALPPHRATGMRYVNVTPWERWRHSK